MSAGVSVDGDVTNKETQKTVMGEYGGIKWIWQSVWVE